MVTGPREEQRGERRPAPTPITPGEADLDVPVAAARELANDAVRRPRDYRRTYFFTTLAALALPAAAVLTSPLLARALGADGRGEVSAILAPAGLATLLATLGIPDAVNYHVARFPGHVRPILIRAIVLSFAWGALAGMLLVLLSPLLLRNVTGYGGLFAAISVTIPAAMVIAALRGCAQGLGRFHTANRERWIAITIRVGVLVVLFAAGGLDVFWAVVVTWASGLASGFVYSPMVRAVLRSSRKADDTGARREIRLSRYGLRIWLSSVASLLVLRLDQVVLGVAVGTRELGFYVIAAAVAEVPQVAAGALQQVVLSRVAAGDASETVARTSRIVVALALVVAVLGSVSVPMLVPLLFGQDFAGAVPVTQVLLFATVPITVATVLSGNLVGTGRPGLAATVQAVGLGLTIALLGVLVPLFGALGAAGASLVTYSVVAVIMLLVTRRTYGLTAASCLLLRRSDLALLRRRG